MWEVNKYRYNGKGDIELLRTIVVSNEVFEAAERVIAVNVTPFYRYVCKNDNGTFWEWDSLNPNVFD